MPAHRKPVDQLVNRRGGRGRQLSVVRRDGAFVAPDAPEGLRAHGRAAWESFWKSDVSSAVDFAADGEDLAHWARCVDERARLWPIAMKNPLVTGSMKQLVPNPLFRVIDGLTRDIDRLSDRFGMNPAARYRLQFTVTEAGKSANQLLAMLDQDLEVPDVIDVEVV